MDKSKLLAQRLNTGTVPIEGVGEVTVRGLSRHEVDYAVKQYEGDKLKQECFQLATCLVDPQLTEDEAEQWLKSAALPEIAAVIAKINELSGFGEGADKS